MMCSYIIALMSNNDECFPFKVLNTPSLLLPEKSCFKVLAYIELI